MKFMNKIDFLEALFSKAYIEISNYITVDEEEELGAIAWRLKAEHKTHLGFKIELKGADIEDLLQTGLQEMEQLEARVEQKKEALKTLHPDKNEWEIMDILRDMPKYYE